MKKKKKKQSGETCSFCSGPPGAREKKKKKNAASQRKKNNLFLAIFFRPPPPPSPSFMWKRCAAHLRGGRGTGGGALFFKKQKKSCKWKKNKKKGDTLMRFYFPRSERRRGGGGGGETEASPLPRLSQSIFHLLLRPDSIHPSPVSGPLGGHALFFSLHSSEGPGFFFFFFLSFLSLSSWPLTTCCRQIVLSVLVHYCTFSRSSQHIKRIKDQRNSATNKDSTTADRVDGWSTARDKFDPLCIMFLCVCVCVCVCRGQHYTEHKEGE